MSGLGHIRAEQFPCKRFSRTKNTALGSIVANSHHKSENTVTICEICHTGVDWLAGFKRGRSGICFRVGPGAPQEGGTACCRAGANPTTAAQENRARTYGDEGKAAGCVPLAALLFEVRPVEKFKAPSFVDYLLLRAFQRFSHRIFVLRPHFLRHRAV